MDTVPESWTLAVYAEDQDEFLAAFHKGDRRVLESIYDSHFETVDRAVARVLAGPDRETVVQEVFCRLVAREGLRRNFQGGSLAAWLATVARNQAIDHARRERAVVIDSAVEPSDGGRFSQWAEAALLIEQFRRGLPEKWVPVFQARFLDRLSQREAAAALGIKRTTLAYQELRVQALLRKFLLAEERR
jgi:RNA polymerase sigma-70 factor (ECF subfamily)